MFEVGWVLPEFWGLSSPEEGPAVLDAAGVELGINVVLLYLGETEAEDKAEAEDEADAEDDAEFEAKVETEADVETCKAQSPLSAIGLGLSWSGSPMCNMEESSLAMQKTQ